MQRSDFHFELPEDLIAQQPLDNRSDSRLLCLDRDNGEVVNRQFTDLIDLLEPGDCLVFNDTEVIPARLFGRKASGGKIEILVERLLDERQLLAHVRASKSPKPGSDLYLEDDTPVKVVGREGDLFNLEVTGMRTALEVMNEIGHVPLPPYINRQDSTTDKQRYQTVYAKKKGAVAAPTAGLHFDDSLLKNIKEKGVAVAFVTLHVGAGTFLPVRVDNIASHKMHSEIIEVSQETCNTVMAAKEKGGRVIAVGTTSVRCLETATEDGMLKPFAGETDIFITPGYHFKMVDALITNFHLPESTLLMLVSAFAGWENTMAAYRHAVNERYRFFSYGDAMFISSRHQPGV